MATFLKKLWKNRDSEHPNRRHLAPTGAANVFDVERDEGLVLEEGHAFDEANMNDLEGRIEAGLAGAAPTAHAVSDATYGAASVTNYGHAKLSDSTSSTSGASAGVAATPAAVKTAMDKANAAMPKAGGAFTGVVSGPVTTSAAAIYRNIMLSATDPGAGSALASGAVLLVYE